MAVRETPSSRSQAVRVENTSMKGSPAEKPKSSMRNTVGRVYTAHARRQPRPAVSLVIVDDQRRVIGKVLAGIDFGRAPTLGQPRRRNLVVDAPADVVFTRPPALGPPGKAIRLRIDPAEDIDHADRPEHLVEPSALLRQKTGVLEVVLPVLQIDFLVGDVPVATDDVVAIVPGQFFQVRAQALHTAELELLALVLRRARRQVQRDDAQVFE